MLHSELLGTATRYLHKTTVPTLENTCYALFALPDQNFDSDSDYKASGYIVTVVTVCSH